MAWNEPSDNGKENNPWGGKRRPQGPPDLEQALRKLQKRLASVFNVNKNAGTGVAAPEQPEKFRLLIIISIAVFLIWVLLGIFIVGPAERAIVLRFGKYVETVGPGPHWIPRFIESVDVVNEQKISTYSYDAQMLTKDANIVSVALAIQYRINDAKNYLYEVVNPQESLQQATASVLRQVIGHTSLDLVLTSGREQIRQEVKDLLDKTLKRYHAGILVTDVAMQPAKAPDEVKEAFDDAIKAQEDEQRFENQAQAYAMQVEPIAKGQAQRLLADAQAYKQQVVLQARGDVSRYLAILPEYQRSPGVTRERLYIDALEYILQNNRKILVDVPGNSNVLYLPLDKIITQDKAVKTASNSVVADNLKMDIPAIPNQSSVNNAATSFRDDYRVRGGY